MVAPREGERDRFEMRGELGVGATGSVYRVFDNRRGEEVALKTLRCVSGADLYRFKREFRSLMGISHPNLATLHELFVVDDEWMFTMELIEGTRFDHYVRTGATSAAALEDAEDATVAVPRRREASGVLDEVRLRAVLIQVADALTALHAAGMVHRDLKPSNVLIDARGRAVILDFGLVVEHESVDRTHDQGSVGTVAYMSPEQAADLPLTPATDWYSVGVMLYEALTGQRPIRGAAHDVLARKRNEDIPAPSSVARDIPPDLDWLCTQLLQREPELRPDGHAVLAALNATPSAATRAIREAATRPAAPASSEALAWTRDALAASRDHMVVAMLRGPHGSGKTRALDAFVEELRTQPDVLVISGTDNSRVQTMLPGLDQALDRLSAHVMALPRAEVDELVHDAAPLARMFPALRRIPMLQLPTLPQSKPLSPADIIREGLGALRRVFHRLGERGPLVLVVDESRVWEDPETRLMTDVFVGPGMPRMLVLLGIDPEVREDNPGLEDFHRWARDHGGDLRQFDLGDQAR